MLRSTPSMVRKNTAQRSSSSSAMKMTGSPSISVEIEPSGAKSRNSTPATSSLTRPATVRFRTRKVFRAVPVASACVSGNCSRQSDQFASSDGSNSIVVPASGPSSAVPVTWLQTLPVSWSNHVCAVLHRSPWFPNTTVSPFISRRWTNAVLQSGHQLTSMGMSSIWSMTNSRLERNPTGYARCTPLIFTPIMTSSSSQGT